MRAFIFLVLISMVSCSEEASQTTSADSVLREPEKLDSIASVPDIDRDNSWSPFHAKYSFSSMPVKVYSGKLVKPDYNSVAYGNDDAFQEYMEERLKGMPINFGGKYTIVERSCGAMCSSIYLIDRKTGKIFTFPKSDGHWGYKYYSTSTLLLANSSLVDNSMTKYLNQWGITPEFYQWTGTSFRPLP